LHLGPPIKPPRIDESGVQYRLYFFDGVGHISTSHEFFAEDDGEAIKIAEAWLEGRAAELWTRDRKVHSWPFSK
jgi:hypothetical protein